MEPTQKSGGWGYGGVVSWPFSYAPASMETRRGIVKTQNPMPPHIRRPGQCQGLDKTP